MYLVFRSTYLVSIQLEGSNISVTAASVMCDGCELLGVVTFRHFQVIFTPCLIGLNFAVGAHFQIP